MNTIPDPPDDIADLLRQESARRGGRKKVSLSELVSHAVREVYGGDPEEPAIVDLKAGRDVVKRSPGNPLLDAEDILDALDD